MKRFAAIILLLTMGVMLGGIYVYFAVRLVHIRQYMRQQLASLPEYRLDCLELGFDEFLKSRVDEHELKVNGRMFDIARMEISGQHLMVYGLYDEAEDNLLAFINTVLQRLHQDEEPLPASLITLLLLNYSVPESVYIPAAPAGNLQHCTPYAKQATNSNLPVLTPPPRQPA